MGISCTTQNRIRLTKELPDLKLSLCLLSSVWHFLKTENRQGCFRFFPYHLSNSLTLTSLLVSTLVVPLFLVGFLIWIAIISVNKHLYCWALNQYCSCQVLIMHSVFYMKLCWHLPSASLWNSSTASRQDNVLASMPWFTLFSFFKSSEVMLNLTKH